MLDQALLLRSRLIKRTDCLTKTQILFILVAIRYLNQQKLFCSIVSIHYFLKKARRTITPGEITMHLVPLVAAGYAIKPNSQVKITEAGKQALSDLDKQLKQARYTYGRSKKPAKQAKGPKPII